MMARTNKANRFMEKTHEGAQAAHMTAMQALRRSVASCFLWEDEFYEDGVEIAKRIHDLVQDADPIEVAKLAIEARTKFKLRHMPLWLMVAMAKTASGSPILGNTIPQVVKRADELSELVSLYWKANPPVDATKTVNVVKVSGGVIHNKPLPAQMKKGLARAFANFDEYHFAKYDRDAAVKIRDVMFLTHPKPANDERRALYERIAKRTLATPDTWEVGLSGGADKRETFERLIREGKLGYLALLRNLRNISEAGCDEKLVREAIIARKGADNVLPFRYVAAAKAAPQYERYLDAALTAGALVSLPGRTAVLVDVSGSMHDKLSARSDMRRMDAAATLASVIDGDVRVYTFADEVMKVPHRLGMAGVDAICNSQSGGTRLFDAVKTINDEVKYDRLIVITDEQAFGPDATPFGYRLQGQLKTLPDPLSGTKGYMINVASAKNGVGYGKWIHIDGFSENVFAFMREAEAKAV